MLNNKTFTTRLNKELAIATKQRDSFQELILSGLEQYDKDGDTYQLSLLISASVAVKSIPTVTIKDYIKSLTDLVYKKNKAGEYQFMRADKHDAKVCNTKPSETWYDWKKAKHNNVKEVDHTKLAIKHLKAINDGKHSTQYLMKVLVESGFTTSQLLNMIDSVSLQEVKAA